MMNGEISWHQYMLSVAKTVSLSVLLLSCAYKQSGPSLSSLPAGAPVTAPVEETCPDQLFGPIEAHIVNLHARRIEVQKIEGRILSEAGEWPQHVRPLFEIAKADSPGYLEMTTGNEEGYVAIEAIPDGSYCFRASAPGWQALVGLVTVDSGAGADTFELRLLLGV